MIVPDISFNNKVDDVDDEWALKKFSINIDVSIVFDNLWRWFSKILWILCFSYFYVEHTFIHYLFYLHMMQCQRSFNSSQAFENNWNIEWFYHFLKVFALKFGAWFEKLMLEHAIDFFLCADCNSQKDFFKKNQWRQIITLPLKSSRLNLKLSFVSANFQLWQFDD